MTAPSPSSEKKRLEVLWDYGVLDTPPESVFDDLTAIAAQVCEAPIALISLVDECRQWFKSKVEEQGGGNYQSMLNDALRAYIERQNPSLEKILRRIVREEIRKAS